MVLDARCKMTHVALNLAEMAAVACYKVPLRILASAQREQMVQFVKTLLINVSLDIVKMVEHANFSA